MNSITIYFTFIVTLVIMICNERRNRWMYRWISDSSVFRYKIPRDELEAWAARWDWQGKCCECQAPNVGASTIKKSCSNSFVVMKVFVPLKLVVLLFEGEKLGEAWRCRFFRTLPEIHILSNAQDPKSISLSFPRLRRNTPVHHQFKLPSYHGSALPHCRTFEDSTCFVMSIQNGKSRAQWILDFFDGAIVLREKLQHFQHQMFVRWPTCLWLCPGPLFNPFLKPASSHGSVPASHPLFLLYIQLFLLAQQILMILYLANLEWPHGQVHPGQGCIQGV